jgi:hypothetical protein
MLPTKFLFIWPSGFREDFLEINQLETRIACSGNVGLVDLKKSSLKPLSQINRNVVGNIYGRSSIKIAHFVLIR